MNLIAAEGGEISLKTHRINPKLHGGPAKKRHHVSFSLSKNVPLTTLPCASIYTVRKTDIMYSYKTL